MKNQRKKRKMQKPKTKKSDLHGQYMTYIEKQLLIFHWKHKQTNKILNERENKTNYLKEEIGKKKQKEGKMEINEADTREMEIENELELP